MVLLGFLGQFWKMSSQFNFHAFDLKLVCLSGFIAFQIQNSVIKFRFEAFQFLAHSLFFMTKIIIQFSKAGSTRDFADLIIFNFVNRQLILLNEDSKYD